MATNANPNSYFQAEPTHYHDIDGLVFAVPALGIVFCQHCKYYIPPQPRAGPAHLSKCFPELFQNDGDAVNDTIRRAFELIPTNARDRSLAHPEWVSSRPDPPDHFPHLPFLPLFHDGLGCWACLYVTRVRNTYFTHCRNMHSHQSDPVEGLPIQGYKIGNGSKYFRVWVDEESDVAARDQEMPDAAVRIENEEAEGGNGNAPRGSLLAILADARHQLRVRQANQPIEAISLTEPNLFLDAMGFVRHLQGRFSFADALAYFPPLSIEAAGQYTTHLRRIANETLTGMARLQGQPVLYELNRRTDSHERNRHFIYRLLPDTLTDYVAVFTKIFSFMAHNLASPPHWAVANHPTKPVVLPAAVEEAFAALFAINPNIAAHDDDVRAALDEALVAAIMSLLDQRLDDDVFHSPLLSAMAFMAVKSGNAWRQQMEYDKCMSGSIKIALTIVFRRATADHRRLLNEYAPAPQGPIPTLLDSVARTMAAVALPDPARRGHLTPLQWLFQRQEDLRHIGQTNGTSVGDALHWSDDPVTRTPALSYKSHNLSLQAFRGLCATAIDDAADRLLAALLIPPPAGTGGIYDAALDDVMPQLPPLAQVHDNISNCSTGYNFLQHEGNAGWVEAGNDYVARRMMDSGVDNPFGPMTQNGRIMKDNIAMYLDAVNDLLDALLVAIHLTSGQPARATELISVRLDNSPIGGLRNVFVRNGTVELFTVYHKSLTRVGQLKPIHRFLPPKLSYVTVLYIWLVRPFALELAMVMKPKNAVGASPYFWPNQLVTTSARASAQAEPGADIASNESEDETGNTVITGQDEFSKQRKYHSSPDRLTACLKRTTLASLGQEINVRDYRHIAIAFTKRFISMKSTFATINDDLMLDPNADDVLDLQAAHSSMTAHINYAKEGFNGKPVTHLFFGFRHASQQWHKVLQVHQEDPRVVLDPGDEDDDFFDNGVGEDLVGDGDGNHTASARQEQVMRFRNFSQDINDDLARAIANNNAKVKLRPHQSSVLKAISEGSSDIIYVAGTGAGKSIAFLGPAIAMPTGMKVLVIPLKSLQHQTLSKLRDLGVTGSI
ncbi:hypothetical protein CLIM01_12135 [Colletotrichum limetticola]|uniref:DEAD/DEAH-box helicase domain-containing protein n=1 Tax=Colletotrichum limetticola TaxID=1209924 RepID=A0ABQ9PFK3_9PEZI|nr:hypothetical protein CLIM01_12135 [Colletotrichum limetticola]